MSSINFNKGSLVSDDIGDVPDREDDAQFFSIAQEYNHRRISLTNHHSIQKMNTMYNYNYKNAPKNVKNSEAKEEKSRKTRSYQEGRQFICGECKNGYLSYPALYTHIKTKHNGIYPEGTIRGKNNNNKKRGRPKTLRKQPTLQYRQQPQSQFPLEYCDLVPRDLVTIATEEQRQEDEKVQITLPMFISQLRELKKSNYNIITLNLIKILTLYLYNIKEFLKVDSMLTVETISAKLVKFINKSYKKILKEYQDESKYYVRKTIPEKYETQYCNYEKPEYLPVFIHEFLKRLDEEEDEMEITFLNDFCQWLTSKNLTFIKLVKPEIYEVGQVNQ